MALLVVEDDLKVRSFLVRGLAEEGFSVKEVGDGTDAENLLRAERFDLALVDWMLPHLSGIDLLRRMRAASDTTPVVLLTAKDAVSDRVEGLNAGADDYLVKPFSFEELIARVKAVLRRSGERPEPKLACADLELDPGTHKVTRAGREIRLTAREFALLHYLLQNAGQVLSRSKIAQAVWDHDFDTASNVVEVYIRYLRAKVDEPFPTRLIHTVRGVGYVIRCES
jgi:two-component system copper resistance phosphate regulon response regulator CusR